MRHPMIVQSRFRCSNHKFRVRERILNQRLFFRSLTASLAGFLFGFDTVVISGAEKTIQSLWELGDFQHGLAMSMALWGYGHWFVGRQLADGSTRSQDAALHRIIRLHRVVGTLCVGVLHRELRDCARMHFRVHRSSRRRSGCGDLGVHFRDLPQSTSRPGAVTWQFHSLDLRGALDAVFPLNGDSL